MTHHLSTLQVKQFCASAIPEDELVAAAIHTANCRSCHERFVEELKRQQGSVRRGFTLAPEFAFRNDHVEFEQLVALADETLDENAKEIIDIHLSICETCREDVRSFVAFREATAREMDTSFGVPDYQATHEAGPTPSWQRLQMRPAYAMGGILLVALVSLIGLVSLTRKFGWFDVSKQDRTMACIKFSPSPKPSVTYSLPSMDSSSVAILKDGAGDVSFDKNGSVLGLDRVSEDSRQYVSRAVLSQRVEAPEVLGRLSGEHSDLRGDANGPQEFTLLHPARTVVIDDRPLFRWESLSGALSYRVYVLDDNGNHVVESEELPPTQTEWNAPIPLRRGQVFSWVVTALINGKKVVSPSASVFEMRFAVLSTENFQELSQLKQSNSHVALGVFYARAGLLNEAEREFQILINLNPQSELPRKWLRSVLRLRQGTIRRLGDSS